MTYLGSSLRAPFSPAVDCYAFSVLYWITLCSLSSFSLETNKKLTETKRLRLYKCVGWLLNCYGKMMGDASKPPWSFQGRCWTWLVFLFTSRLWSCLFCFLLVLSLYRALEFPILSLSLNKISILKNWHARWWFPFLSGILCAELFERTKLSGGRCWGQLSLLICCFETWSSYVAQPAWKSQCSPGQTADFQSCCLSAEMTDAISCMAFLSEAFQLYENSILKSTFSSRGNRSRSSSFSNSFWRQLFTLFLRLPCDHHRCQTQHGMHVCMSVQMPPQQN